MIVRDRDQNVMAFAVAIISSNLAACYMHGIQMKTNILNSTNCLVSIPQ